MLLKAFSMEDNLNLRLNLLALGSVELLLLKMEDWSCAYLNWLRSTALNMRQFSIEIQKIRRLYQQIYKMAEEEHLKKTSRILIELNKSGLASLSKDKEKQAYEYFKQAQKIVAFECNYDPKNHKFQQLLAVTYNNLAIYYKKTNKPKSALIYLKKALQIEALKLEDWKATAGTHLNISAIYSYMSKHEQAINNISLADQIIEKLRDSELMEDQKVYENIKLIAAYNLAVEYENIKKYDQSLQAYKKTVELANKGQKKEIKKQSEDSIVRVESMIAKNNRKLSQLLQKIKQNQEKGHYESMRKNKKNFKSSAEYTSVLETKKKKYDIYAESKSSVVLNKLPKIKTPKGAQRYQPLRKQQSDVV